jgi:energy-coupling factor transport system substrate-specific component
MSWEAVSFLILGAGLLAGFAWYERSRPPSQVVALVAALAALAIAGRVAFAAFPNVKPTTDIVIFAGYALGPAPGFAVGALTALVSNFWFGQGPWTPWQMAGWGLCGLLGAALALGGRNIGRFTLAAACGVAGVAYGALLNFSLMATYGGDLTFKHFLVLESRAVPFDAAHAIGNITFALIAGPAMIRMLVRFRERFQWRPSLSGALGTLLAALAVVALLPGVAHASNSGKAARWLVSAQNEDGGWGASPGDPSGTEMTGWVMLGLEAAGRNPLDVSHGGATPVAYLRYRVDQLDSSGDFARTILALEGAGVNPHDFGGRDLVSALAKRRRDDGSYDGWPGSTAYAVVALRAAGAIGSLERSISWLAGVQNQDGGWGDTPGSPSNADVTGAVLQAIPDSAAADRGVSYLRKHQDGNGGFRLGGGDVNSQSTAWAMEGMLAAGGASGAVKDAGGYLSSQQQGDGHFRYSDSSDKTSVWVTGEALVAASGKSLPVAAPPREQKAEPEKTASPAPAESPLTIPGPSSAPSASPAVPAAPPGSGGGGAAVPPGSTAGGAGHAGPLVPASPATPAPAAPATAAPEGEGLTEATPTAAIEAGDGDGGSPWIPIGIGLGVGAIALLAPWLLGKRYAW